MNSSFKTNKRFMILLFLLVITIFLMEIPGLVFQREDKLLLKESASSKYEMKIIRNIKSLSSKIDFLRQKDTLFTVGYADIYEEEAIAEKTTRLFKEFDKLTGAVSGTYEEFLKQTEGNITVHGFETQIICRSETEKEQYVWKIGMAFFQLSKYGDAIVFIYDVDTYQIIFLEWILDETFDYFANQNITECEFNEAISQYYDEDILEKITMFKAKGYGVISVFPEDDRYENRLLIELYNLHNYYWEISEKGEDEIWN